MRPFALPDFVQRWLPRDRRRVAVPTAGLWRHTIQAHPFLATLNASEQDRLRSLSAHFLAEKTFQGAHGFVVTDAMSLSIAAQACLPLLHIRHPTQARDGRHTLDVLDWYKDFIGIVVQPGASVAWRELTDSAGVVHRYREVLAGEAMHHGPVMLSWADVSRTPHTADSGHNVVIHEFAHKIDMYGKAITTLAQGDPLLPDGFFGLSQRRDAAAFWRVTMQAAYDQFCEAVARAERFGEPRPWLDAYAAQDAAEFFAVTCEAYFVQRTRFSTEFPSLVRLYDGFFC